MLCRPRAAGKHLVCALDSRGAPAGEEKPGGSGGVHVSTTPSPLAAPARGSLHCWAQAEATLPRLGTQDAFHARN